MNGAGSVACAVIVLALTTSACNNDHRATAEPGATPSTHPSASSSPNPSVRPHHPRDQHSTPTPTPSPTPSPTTFPIFGRTVESSTTLPSKGVWLADVVATLERSRASQYLLQRARSGDGRLAINLDIDNTVNETHYSGSGAIASMADLIDEAHRLGYGILYNTGREERIRRRTLALLHRDGLPVDGLCMRRSGEGLVHSKQRCRDEYARAGWTLIENIGNNPTDLAGDGYELGIMLPNYGRRLA